MNPVLMGSIHLVDGNTNQVVETITPAQTERYSFPDQKTLNFTFSTSLQTGPYAITTDDNFVFTMHHMVVEPANLGFSFATNLGTVEFNPSTQYSVVGEIVYATPNEACGPITNGVANKIALIDRGTCAFVDKVTNAVNAQAAGTILANNVSGQLNPAGTPVQSIPSVAVLFDDGNLLKTAMQNGTQYAHIYNKPVRAIAGGSWTFIVTKQNQSITFNQITDKTLGGSATFTLDATATSSLPVAYTTTSDKITIAGNVVTLVKAGRVSIDAGQAGNDAFNPAPVVTQTFCINPAKPTVSISNANTPTVTLTSNASSGNQWFLDDVAIPGATNTTLSVTAAGVYKVQATADDCPSDFSANVPIIVTGDLENNITSTIKVYPNPVENYLELHEVHGEVKEFHVFDMAGRETFLALERTGTESYRTNMQSMAKGMYLLRLHEGTSIHQVKVIKK
jgi:hypothetical protein